MIQHNEVAIAQGHALCHQRGIQVLPYGNSWWLLGQGVSRVVSSLAGLSHEDICPVPVFHR